jgi:hypothetical protein
MPLRKSFPPSTRTARELISRSYDEAIQLWGAEAGGMKKCLEVKKSAGWADPHINGDRTV